MDKDIRETLAESLRLLFERLGIGPKAIHTITYEELENIYNEKMSQTTDLAELFTTFTLMDNNGKNYSTLLPELQQDKSFVHYFLSLSPTKKKRGVYLMTNRALLMGIRKLLDIKKEDFFKPTIDGYEGTAKKPVKIIPVVGSIKKGEFNCWNLKESSLKRPSRIIANPINSIWNFIRPNEFLPDGTFPHMGAKISKKDNYIPVFEIHNVHEQVELSIFPNRLMDGYRSNRYLFKTYRQYPLSYGVFDLNENKELFRFTATIGQNPLLNWGDSNDRISRNRDFMPVALIGMISDKPEEEALAVLTTMIGMFINIHKEMCEWAMDLYESCFNTSMYFNLESSFMDDLLKNYDKDGQVRRTLERIEKAQALLNSNDNSDQDLINPEFKTELDNVVQKILEELDGGEEEEQEKDEDQEEEPKEGNKENKD